MLLNRLLAFFIDYLLIVFYASVLFLVAWSIFNWYYISPRAFNPYVGQLVGFFTLTLPVFAYFFMMEKSKWKGTIGKKLLKIQVNTEKNHVTKNIALRNLLKFLPWEIAHTGVHWIFYDASQTDDIPYWMAIVLIVPQVIVFCYISSIIWSKGKSSIYDRLAKTYITTRESNT